MKNIELGDYSNFYFDRICLLSDISILVSHTIRTVKIYERTLGQHINKKKGSKISKKEQKNSTTLQFKSRCRMYRYTDPVTIGTRKPGKFESPSLSAD